MSYLSTFTNLIEEFIDKLSQLYPEDQDFVHFKTFLLLLKKTNPRKILDMFNKHCLQYKEHIIAKNEEFILLTDFVKDKTNNSSENKDTSNDEHLFNVMIKLRHYWKSMDKETIENIWKYLNIFILLSSKIKNQTN